MIGADGLFAGKDALLDFEVVDTAVEVFNGRRGGVLAEGEFGAGGIEDADGFIGQLAAGHVAVRKADGGFEPLIEDSDLMVFFEHTDDAAHHHHADRFGGLFDLDDLEAAGERGVLFKVLFVLAPGGGGHGAHLAAREGGLEQVGGIALAGLAAGADHGVGLVDEEDDGLGAGLDLFDETLEPVFKLAFDAGAGLQQGEVERVQFDVLERRGHVALHNAEGKAFDDGGLADARFAGENRVVLAAAEQDVDHLADFAIAAKDRVDLSFPGLFGEVFGVGVEVGLLAAARLGRACRAAARRTGRRERRHGLVRGIDNRGELLFQSLGIDLLQLL